MKSFLVLGLGRFGSAVARELINLGHEVLGIDESEEKVQKCAEFITHAIVGDAKDETVLKSIGVRNFDCAIVAMADANQDSVLVTLMLKEMGVGKIVCKVSDALHMKVLQRVGADRVVFPERDMGIRLAHNLSTANIIDFIEISDDYSIIETVSPKMWEGKSFSEIEVRAKYGINVIAVRNAKGNHVTVSPSGSYVIQPADVLVVVGGNDSLGIIRDIQDRENEHN